MSICTDSILKFELCNWTYDGSGAMNKLLVTTTMAANLNKISDIINPLVFGFLVLSILCILFTGGK